MKKSFFLVEDHSLMRQGITGYLAEHSDFACAGCVAGAQDFLDAMARGEKMPDVLVTDLNLDGGLDGGLNLIRTSRARFPHIKIVAYSMYAAASVVSAALAAGADGYVSKLSEDAELLAAMVAVLSGRTYIEPQIAAELVAYERSLSIFTRRETDILRLVLQGKPNTEIAQSLGIQKRAVENYISRIYDKTGCRTKEELAAQWGKKINASKNPCKISFCFSQKKSKNWLEKKYVLF